MANLILFFLVFVAGLNLTLAFAPFNFYFIAFLSPAILLTSWIAVGSCHARASLRHSRVGRNLMLDPRLCRDDERALRTGKIGKAFWLGFVWGLGFFGFGASWIYISVHEFGNASVFLAAIITIFFILYLSLFPAIHGLLLAKFFPKNNLFKLIFIFPLSWVFMEFLRGKLFTGFPWLFLGYSQITTPLKNIAPIFGVYGVSFFVALISGAIVALLFNIFSRKKIISIKNLLLISIVLVVIFSCVYLDQITWTEKVGDSIKVSLIQGNIPERAKWDPNNIPKMLADYEQLTELNIDSRIIIWPEGAIPVFQDQVSDFLDDITKLARRNNNTIVTGIMLRNLLTDEYYNGMISLGVNNSTYLKYHLVPFGEYQPLQNLTGWFSKYFDIPMSTLANGAYTQADFKVANLIIAPFICYEIAYPIEALRFFPRANLIITITDDSWFGRSIASAQHLQIARMRSLETGRYQLMASNTGKTAIINPRGEIIAVAPEFARFSLNGKIYAMRGSTPWIYLSQVLNKLRMAKET